MTEDASKTVKPDKCTVPVDGKPCGATAVMWMKAATYVTDPATREKKRQELIVAACKAHKGELGRQKAFSIGAPGKPTQGWGGEG